MSMQRTFLDVVLSGKKKVTRREEFLSEMERVIPWGRLVSLVEEHYSRGEVGRPPIGAERMLRVLFLQHFYGLSDPGVEEALYDMPVMARFAKVDLTRERVPDETTLVRFRQFLSRHGLSERIFSEVNDYLSERGMGVRRGTIVDATIVKAPSSTKNREKKRDPEMSSTKKGSQWHFGMKSHIGVDSGTGLIHSVVSTTAREHDLTVADKLLHGSERTVYGDRGYEGLGARLTGERNPKLKIIKRRQKGRELTEYERAVNRSRSKIRAKVEHPFHVIKCIFHHRKVRYRGIRKNHEHLLRLYSLANLFMARRILASAAP